MTRMLVWYTTDEERSVNLKTNFQGCSYTWSRIFVVRNNWYWHNSSINFGLDLELYNVCLNNFLRPKKQKYLSPFHLSSYRHNQRRHHCFYRNDYGSSSSVHWPRELSTPRGERQNTSWLDFCMETCQWRQCGNGQGSAPYIESCVHVGGQ